MTRVTGVGTVVDPAVRAFVLQTLSGAIVATAISTVTGSSAGVVMTAIGVTIGTGVAAGSHS